MPTTRFDNLSKYIDLLLDAVCVVDTDGRFVYVSAGCERVFGYLPEEMVGRNMLDLIHPDDIEVTLQTANRVNAGAIIPHFENRYLRKDGSVAHIMWSARRADDDELRIGVARDITQQKRTEAMRTAVFAISEAANETTELTALMPRIEQVLKEQLPSLDIHISLTSDPLNSGAEIFCKNATTDDEKALLHFVSTQINNAIQRQQLHARLRQQALHDDLTGLPNRTLFRDRLATLMQRSKRDQVYFSILYIDLDHFKAVNDKLGHSTGDQLLEQAATRLLSSIRSNDTVARFGGDEFVVLLTDVKEKKQAVAIAQKIIDALSRPFTFLNLDVTVSPSIGIALYPTHGEDEDDLLRHADTAMYQAKDQGGNRYQISQPAGQRS